MRASVLMIGGKHNQFFPVQTSQKPMYELLGTPRDHKKQYIYEASHAVPLTWLPNRASNGLTVTLAR